MKVGSLVICPNGFKSTLLQPLAASEEIIYTVRSITLAEGLEGIRLEEVINPHRQIDNIEYAYHIDSFREIQPPLDLTELLEETLETV
jgi:hypothetical protein